MDKEERRFAGRCVSNLGANVAAWCEQTGNGSSMVDVCEKHAIELDLDPHVFDGILFPDNGDPVGEDGWGGNVEHPRYEDDITHCAIPWCKVRLGDEQVTYSLLVSNVGRVRNDNPNYHEVKRLFDEYKASKRYEQVTMWSSEEDDPIEEAYTEGGL